MSEKHLISRELYKILYMVKKVVTNEQSLYQFKEYAKMHKEELQKLKRPIILKNTEN